MNSDSYQKLEQSKPFKLCFNNEIHRISKLPTDYKTLVQSVVAAFKNNLPAAWALQYEDADGDRVMLTSDEDYRAMIECEAESSAKSIKIYLLPIDRPARDYTNSELDLSKAESTEYSQILPPQAAKSETSEILAKPEPEPFVEEKIEAIPEPVPEIKEVVPEPEEKVEEPQVEESKVEQSHMEPVVLAQNLSNTSAYIDAAFDYIDNKPQVQEVAEAKPVEAQAEEEEEKKPRQVHRLRKCGRGTKPSRKERIRPAVTEIMIDNVPLLAELITNYMKNPSEFALEELKKKYVPEESVKSVKSIKSLDESMTHNRVTCDGCGTNPILGIRYKCSVCEDFDYCENCEASIEHPHPFLKIKDPKHKPKAIITILEEDLPQAQEQTSLAEIGKALSQRISNLSKETVEQVSKLTEKLFASEKVEEVKPVEPVVPEKKVEEIKKPVEEEKVQEVKQAEPVKVVEPVVPEKKAEPVLNADFVREICTIPAKITVNEKSIYKTIVIKNTGKVEWPCSTRIVNVSGASGTEVKLLPLAPGKEFSCILVIECPKDAGDYVSEWRLIYRDDKNEVQNLGDSFFVSFAVYKPEIIINSIPLVESQIIKKDVPAPIKKVYSSDVQKKAKTIKDIFPEANTDDLLEFISKTPQLSIEELLENYMA